MQNHAPPTASLALLAGAMMFSGEAAGTTFFEDFEGNASQWQTSWGTYTTGSDYSGDPHSSVVSGASIYGGLLTGAGVPGPGTFNNGGGVISQTVALSASEMTAAASGGATYNFSGWLASWTSGSLDETTNISVQFFGDTGGATALGSAVVLADGRVEGTSTTPSGPWNRFNWSAYTASGTVPAGAQSFQIIFDNNLGTPGADGSAGNDAYADLLKFDVIVGEYVPGGPGGLTSSLDEESGAVTLNWTPPVDPYDAAEAIVLRDGLQLAVLTSDLATYIDSPPLSLTAAQTFNYVLRFLDSGGGTAIELETSISRVPGGLAYELVANYQFENGFRDTASKVPAHDGTAVNGASITGNGVYGHCVNFLDQLKQGVRADDHPTLDFGSSTDFTVSLWMKREGAMNSSLSNGEASDGVLLSKQDWSNGSSPGWGLYATSDGGVKWNLAGSSRKSGNIVSGVNAGGVADGRWHHILVSNTRSGAARCFVDGVFKKSINISGAGSVDNSMALSMGVDGNGSYSWKGSMDEVAIWNRALGDNEALEVFESSTMGMALSGKGIVDSDEDGMSDEWEQTHFGNLTQDATSDFDHDGRSNFLEYSEGSDPEAGGLIASSRLTGEELDGQIYPVLHYLRPALSGDVRFVPEASPDLDNWTSGDEKFSPFGNPVDVGGGQQEYAVRYYQSIDAALAGRMMFRVRMESRYQAAIAETVEPTVELRNGLAVVTWTTAKPSVTVLNYGANDQTTSRFEDYTLTTYHEVVIDVQAGEAFTYTVIQVDEGVETRSKTFTISGLWDYSPPPVPDQYGYNSGGGWAARADEILALPGVLDRGYCLDYLCGDGRLAYELARKSQLVVIGVEDTQVEVDAARAFLTERRVYGSRVTVVLASDLANLPFPSDFFNLIVSQSQVAAAGDYALFKSGVGPHAIPARGVVAGLDGGVMQADPPKPSLPGTGSWTMEYGNPANTSASVEEFSGKTSMSEFELRWLGRPGPEIVWDRQLAEQAPLAANGRFYCQGAGRILGLDSHNGSVLWTKELDDAQRFNLLRDAGHLTADDEAVWLALRKECWKLDGDTGHLTVFPLLEGPRSDLDYCWNYICRTGDHLLGTASVDEASYKEHWGSSFWYVDAGGSMANQVVSDNLFSLDKDTGDYNWEYSDGLILSVTITVGDGKVFFLETRNASALSGVSRRLSTSIWKTELHLVCLDLETGTKLWDQASSFTGGTQTVFLMYDEASDKLVLSAGDGANHLYAYRATDGVQVWSKSYSVHKSDHGGKNQHPVLMGGEIFLAPNVLDIATGNIKRSTMPKTNGCNTYWGSKNLLFYRTGYSGKGLSMWPTTGGSSTGIDHIRGACWLNWAPADGMFLIQEKSSGCSCGAWVHISLGWGPN